VYVKSREVEGFTLTELLVVVAVISILTSLLLPVLVVARSKAQTIRCLSNFKQLHAAWMLYSQDFLDYLAPNSDNGYEGRDNDNPAWVAGTMSFDTNPVSVDEATNTDYLVGPQYAEFGSIGYYAKEPKIYHCPADKSTVTFNGRAWPRARSLAMNSWVGFGTRDWLQPPQPPNYRLNIKMTDLHNPGPADTLVFIDEREDSINDGWFAIDVVNQGPAARWVDLPASRHNHGAVVSFADGHAQRKKWLDGRTDPPATLGLLNARDNPCPNNADVNWVQQRTTGLEP
jgi:prepilin-type N-terminal cleavage/methylation domain-containing protein/prepilin-type processing-associated H-X9-DG protein